MPLPPEATDGDTAQTLVNGLRNALLASGVLDPAELPPLATDEASTMALANSIRAALIARKVIR